MKKERNHTFSYLDVFLILILFLVLSFAIYHFTEKSREKESIPDLSVSLSAEIDPEIDFFPKEGEALYAESGEILGSVESVTIEESGSAGRILITCKMRGVKGKAGDEMQIETPSGICQMTVESIEEILKSAKGES